MVVVTYPIMQKMRILNKKEVKNILSIIKKQWDAEPKLDYAFLMNKKGKLYIAKKELFDIDQEKIRIDSMGLYFGTMKNGELRLSIEGSQIVGPYAKRNIVELKKRENISWLRGEDISMNPEHAGYIFVSHSGDFLGCGKISQGFLKNFYPKSRRICV